MKISKRQNKIKISFTQDPVAPKRLSVFLAGPTPREPEVESWRPEAIELFEKHTDQPLTIFAPEPNWEKGITFAELNLDYADQIIEWEHEALEASSIILFWVPRDLKTMPAFTTNFEMGMYLKSGKIAYGRPKDAPKTRYLDYCYEKFVKEQPKDTLESLIISVVEKINKT